MEGRTRALLLVLALAACGGDATRSGDAPPLPESHARMVALLAEIRAQAAEDNVYVGEGAARELRARLAALPPHAPAADEVALLRPLARAELALGREEEALALLERALARAGTEAERLRVLFDLGVANLRRAETLNCCARNDPESCLLPLRGGGIHTRPEPARRAMECLREVVRLAAPGSDDAHAGAWLLNLAAMTVAAWPDGVPAPWRIEADAFDSEEPFPRFVNVAEERGVATFSQAGGAAGDDFDGDGDLDLVVSSWDPGGQIRYFENDGGVFEERTEAAGLTGIYGGLNLVHADYDNDGDLDVYVLRGGWLRAQGRHPNSLLRNDGHARFTDVTFAAGLGDLHYPTQTAAWADYDNDGDLDLYVGNEHGFGLEAPGQLFRNEGDGTFRDVAALAGVTNDRYAKGVVWGDFDGDRWPDLYVSNYDGRNRLYRNLGNGRFEDVARELGVTGPRFSFPAWFWDHDNDGWLDLFVSAYDTYSWDVGAYYLGRPVDAERARLYRNDGAGGLADVAEACGLTRPTQPMGANFGDLDNDGWLDFYLGTGNVPYTEVMPNVMYRNHGGGSFADVTTAGGFGHLQKGHGVVFADFDGDGDLDVFEQMGGLLRGDAFADALYENPGFPHHWLKVRLVGTRSNRCAIGARIRVVAGGRSIYRHVSSGGSFGANPFEQTIGLGTATKVDRLEVFWPTTGETQRFHDLPADTSLRIVEGEPEPR